MPKQTCRKNYVANRKMKAEVVINLREFIPGMLTGRIQ